MAVSGYNVGTAFVQVLPSFEDFHKKADEAVRKMGPIRPEIDPRMKKAADKLDDFQEDARKLTLNPKLDSTGLDKGLKEYAKRQSRPSEAVTVTTTANTKPVEKAVEKLDSKAEISVKLRPEDDVLLARINEIQQKQKAFLLDIDARLGQKRQRIQELAKVASIQANPPEADRDALLKQIRALERRRVELLKPTNKQLDQVEAKLQHITDRFRYTQLKIDADIESAASKISDAKEQAAKGDASIDVDANTELYQAKIDELESRKVRQQVEFAAETRQLQTEIQKLESTKLDKVATIDANIRGYKAKVEELKQIEKSLAIDVPVESAKAEAEIERLEAKKISITAKADADIAKAEQELSSLAQQANRLDGKDINVQVNAQGATTAMTLLAAGVVALGGIVALAPVAAAGLLSVAGAATSAGAATFAAFQGIGTAYDAMAKASQSSAIQSMMPSGAGGSAARRIEQAQESLARARQMAARTAVTSSQQVQDAVDTLSQAQLSADRAAIQSAQDVADARQSLARSRVTAAQNVAAAERRLASAQREAQRAQQDLSEARERARENLQDLKLALRGGELGVQRAELRLELARKRLSETRPQLVSDKWMQDLRLDVDEASLALDQAKERLGDLKKRDDEASRQGIAGSDPVVAAKQRVADSVRAIEQAERNLAQTRVQASQRVADAQESLAQAQQQAAWSQQDAARRIAQAEEGLAQARQRAAWSQQDAARRVAEAQESLAEAMQKTARTGNTAMAKLEYAMSKLTPAGRSFVKFLYNEARPALKSISDAAQSALLPKLEKSWRQMLKLTPLFRQEMSQTASVLGDLAVKGAKMMTSGPWQAKLETIMTGNAKALRNYGEAGFHLADAFTTIWAAASPLVVGFSKLVREQAQAFDQWITAQEASGELATYLDKLAERTELLFQTLSDVVTSVVDFASALGPLLNVLLPLIGTTAKFIGNLASMSPLLTSLVVGAGLLTVATLRLGRGIGNIRAAFLSAKSGFMGFGDSMRNTRRRIRGFRDGSRSAFSTVSTAAGLMALNTRESLGGMTDSTRRYRRSLSTLDTATSTTLGSMGSTVGRVSQTWSLGMDTIVDSSRRASRTMTSGLGRAVSGVAGVFGGPWGLAITGAITALGFLASAQAEAAAAAKRHQQAQHSLAQQLLKTDGKITGATRAFVKQELSAWGASEGIDGLLTSVSKLLGPQAVPKLVDAYLRGGESLDQLRQGLLGVAKAHESSSFQSIFNGEWNELLNPAEQASRTAAGLATNLDATGDQAFSLYEALGKMEPTLKGARKQMEWLKQSAGGVADEQNDAAYWTDQHRLSVEGLVSSILSTAEARLSYEDSIARVAQTQKAVNEALENNARQSPKVQSALRNNARATIGAIKAAGRYAAGIANVNSEAERNAVKQRAMRREAVRLANKHKGPLPAAMQEFIDKLGVVKNKAGKYETQLKDIPPKVLTDILANTDSASEALKELVDYWEKQVVTLDAKVNWIDRGGPLPGTDTVNPNSPLGMILGLGNADGRIVGMAGGGRFSTMTQGVADVVPPNTWRIIGDRAVDDEAYIPINSDARSRAILAETADRMGFGLSPQASGGIIGMADGGMVAKQGQQNSGILSAVGVPLTPANLRELARATARLTDRLQRMWQRLTQSVVPSLEVLERHAGTLAPRALTRLHNELPPLQVEFVRTGRMVGNVFTGMTTDARGATRDITGYFGWLQRGLRQVGRSFASTAGWVNDSWYGIRAAAADPTRWVLNKPFNAGLISAWNRINSDFGLGNSVNPVPVPFAFGGFVSGPGTETSDSIPAMLSNNEFVVRSKWAKKVLPFLRALNSGQPEALQAAGAGMYAKGGVVADTGSALNAAVSRGTEFAAAQHGKPYIWGGAGPHGYDCSGIQAAVTRVLRGESNPYRRLGTTFTMPWPGFVSGLRSTYGTGVSDSGVGHMAGTLAGNNIEAGGAPSMTKFVTNAAGAKHPQFTRHYSLPVVGGTFVPGGGAFNPASMVGPEFAKTYDLIEKIPQLFPGNVMGKPYGSGVARSAADATKGHAVDRLQSLYSTSAGAGSPAVKSAVQAVASQYGWGNGPQWNAIKWIIDHESDWNPAAQNPTSSAAGLFQKMTSVHGPISPKPGKQAQWGMSYLDRRYGDPLAAKQHWLNYGWYDQGGYLPPGYSMVYNGTGQQEAVLTGDQWSDISRLADLNGGGGDRPYIGQYIQQLAPGSSPEAYATETMTQVRHVTKGAHP